MQINLNNCFPESEGGDQGPLPKQRLFMRTALDPNLAKYSAYVGGIGSGKTLIGCITVLAWAVLHPGDYLIARQFMPELTITTYKTFLEICPPELIEESRVADKIVRIKSRDGKTSNILFRGLEEPDKLRSLNLSGFYIDEGSQVSENAFTLLQGRLRGAGLRKGIITTNPAGHDWIYRWFFKKDHLRTDQIKEQFYLIKAPSTENVHLPEGYVETMLDSWSDDRIKREIYGSFDAFEGMVYTEWDHQRHVVRPFKVPEGWTRFVGIDHGYRNPTAVLWAACDEDGDVYVYREFYEREWEIPQICTGHREKGEPGINALTAKEKIEVAAIDPSTNAHRNKSTQYNEYLEHLTPGFPLILANNSVQTGIDRVKQFMNINKRTGKPRLYVFSSCPNLIDEISKYRWKELKMRQQGKMNEKEEPMKKDDHAVDALRYMLMTRPEPALEEQSLESKFEKKGYTMEYYLQKGLEKVKKPKPKDPFEGGL